MKLIEKHKCFNGDQEVYSHNSSSNKCLMQFAVYSPEKKIDAPVLYFLSGITCNEQNFIQKSGYQKFASENKIAIVVPDTSPRGEDVPDDEDYKLGKGAGFYLNATSEKWSQNYNMYDYTCLELPKLINQNFDFSKSKIGIFGHSMGGGGAIQCAIKNRNLFKSISAFSPICSFHKSNFAKEARDKYLSNNIELINSYDPLYLLQNNKNLDQIKIDVGLDDDFLDDLFINDFEKICVEKKQQLIINKHKGYDHGYYFIQSLIEDHIKYHASILTQ